MRRSWRPRPRTASVMSTAPDGPLPMRRTR
jgi:hypothetical protein